MSATPFLQMCIGTYIRSSFAAVARKCPTTQFLNPMDHRARALVMAGTSLHTGARHIGMG
jgi:hypothetical protein